MALKNEEESTDQRDMVEKEMAFVDMLDVEDEEEGVKNSLTFFRLRDFEDKVKIDSYRTFCKHLLIVGRGG